MIKGTKHNIHVQNNKIIWLYFRFLGQCHPLLLLWVHPCSETIKWRRMKIEKWICVHLKKMNFLKFPYLSIFYGLYLSCTSFTPTTCRFVLMFRPCLLWLHLVYLRHCLVSFNYPLLVLHKTPKGVIWLIMLVTILNSVRRLMRFLLSNSKYCIFSVQIWKLIEQCLTPNHGTPPI